MAKLIKNWKELSEIPNESSTHILEVDVKGCNAMLYSKNPKDYNEKLSYMRQVNGLDIYLSTHTFYGPNYKRSGKLLRACGFDVELENWDRES